MFELLEPPAAAEPAALLDGVRAASRAETRAAAQRLAGIWNLYKVRLRETGDHAEWAMDTWDAVAAEVAAALNISLGLAGSHVRRRKRCTNACRCWGWFWQPGTSITALSKRWCTALI